MFVEVFFPHSHLFLSMKPVALQKSLENVFLKNPDLAVGIQLLMYCFENLTFLFLTI